MLNPLVAWEPGTTVRYHGTLTDLHGEYRAFPCRCTRCDVTTVRFELRETDGQAVIDHVQPRSITPA